MADNREAVSQADEIAKERWRSGGLQQGKLHLSELIKPKLEASSVLRYHYRRTQLKIEWPGWLERRQAYRGVQNPEEAADISSGSDSLPVVNRRLERIEDSLARLESAVQELRTIAEEISVTAHLSVLPGLKLRRPVPVMIDKDAEDVVARWIEAELTGIGRSEQEALQDLADNVAEVRAELQSMDPRDISGNAQRMLEVIDGYVAPNP